MDHHIQKSFSHHPVKTEAPLLDGLMCPICGRTIQASTKFCSHCSAAILRRYCGGCKKLVPDAAKNCPYCGTSAKVPIRTHGFNRSVLSPVIVVALFFGLWMLGQKSSGDRLQTTDFPSTTPLAGITNATASSQPVTVQGNAQPGIPPPVASKSTSPANPAAVREGFSLNVTGHELIKQKKFQEAVPILQQAVNKLKDTGTPEYPYALFNLAQATRLSGRPKEAIPLLEECLKIIPNQELARGELARTYQVLAATTSAQPQQQ